MPAPDSMHAYYSARAQYMAKNWETDASSPVQGLIAELKALVMDKAALEVACGTGNWTRVAAPWARSIVATDYSEGMLAVARSRQIPKARFLQDDAYQLAQLGTERFEAGFAMWLVSHLVRARLDEFFRAFHARLRPGAKVLLVDDIRRMDDGDAWYSKLATRDTYEVRRLPNGESYEIVKSYFTAEQLRVMVEPYGENIRVQYERPFWRLTYEVKLTG